MELRLADPEDADAIREVARAAWETDYPDVVSRETVLDAVDEWYDPDALRESIGTAGTVVVVADDGDVVGFAHAVLSTETWTGAILRSYVHPDRRGGGVGSRLVERTVGELRARDCERIEAMALAANEVGDGFYRSAGFECVATEATTIGGEVHDEHRYVYRGE
jgi:ribosomal protein S18 acetylase RimI-like enzyme